MKKTILFGVMLVLLAMSAMAASVTRTVTDSGNQYVIRYTATSSGGSYGGIIEDTIPTGFSFSSSGFLSSFDVSAPKYTGQKVEIPFAGSTSGQYAEVTVNKGTTSGYVTGKVTWEDQTTMTLNPECLVVGGTGCDGNPNTQPPGDDDTDDGESDNMMLYIIIGAAGLLFLVTMNKK